VDGPALLDALSALPGVASGRRSRGPRAACPGPRAAARGGARRGHRVAIQGRRARPDIGAARGARPDGAVRRCCGWPVLSASTPSRARCSPIAPDRRAELAGAGQASAWPGGLGTLLTRTTWADVVVLAGVVEAAVVRARRRAPRAIPSAPPQPADERGGRARGYRGPRGDREFGRAPRRELWTRVAGYEEHVAAARPRRARFARVPHRGGDGAARAVGTRGKVQADQARARVEELRPPEEALPARPFSIAVQDDDVTSGVVLTCAATAPRLVTLASPMRSVGNTATSRRRSPARKVRVPAIDYFIEGFPGAGRPHAVMASARGPVALEGRSPRARRAAPHPRASRDGRWTTPTGNRLRGQDKVPQTEGWFGVRTATPVVRALRMGSASTADVGGSATSGSEDARRRNVGLTTGYRRTERLGFVARVLHHRARPAGGAHRPRHPRAGAGAESASGTDQKTNLCWAARLLGCVGGARHHPARAQHLRARPHRESTRLTNQARGRHGAPPTPRPGAGGRHRRARDRAGGFESCRIW